MRYPIVVRIDDVCPTMDEMKFKKAIDALLELGIKPLLGIIPDCQDPQLRYGMVDNFWEKMRRLGSSGFPLAMHGVHHVYTQKKKGLVSARPLSEFVGLTLEEQIKLLKHGQKTLNQEGIETDTFFAPGHSYDVNTLTALSSIGFKYVSDGRSLMPYELCGIKCIPVTAAYRLHMGRGLLTIAMHPSAESDHDLLKLIAFLKTHRDRIIQFDDAKQLKSHSRKLCRFSELMNMSLDKAIIRFSKFVNIIRRK